MGLTEDRGNVVIKSLMIGCTMRGSLTKLMLSLHMVSP